MREPWGLPEANPWFCESRLRVPCFLTCLFFCSRSWDSPIALVGHPGGRQEPGRDGVGIAAARAPLTRQNAVVCQLSEVTGCCALTDPCDRGQGPHAGKAATSAISEGDKVLQGPAQRRSDGAVGVESDGNKGKHGATG